MLRRASRAAYPGASSTAPVIAAGRQVLRSPRCAVRCLGVRIACRRYVVPAIGRSGAAPTPAAKGRGGPVGCELPACFYRVVVIQMCHYKNVARVS